MYIVNGVSENRMSWRNRLVTSEYSTIVLYQHVLLQTILLILSVLRMYICPLQCVQCTITDEATFGAPFEIRTTLRTHVLVSTHDMQPYADVTQ